MRKYRQYNWPELLQRFEASGLTQTQFCAEQEINPKYFSQKRLTLMGLKPSAFDKIEANCEPPKPDLTIQVGRCHIHCPKNMSIESFALLVHRLA